MRLTSLLVTAAAAASALASPLDVGKHAQLFIDNRFIEASENITLEMQPAQKLGRIVGEDGKPISEHVSRVIADEQTIRLYVGAESLTLLESTDGFQFRRTASIPCGALPTIFLDEHDPDPNRRYKLFYLRLSQPHNPDTDGVYASASADGLEFGEPLRVLPLYTDNPCVVWWDARINTYVIYTRVLALNHENQRRITRIEVDDPLAPWPYTPTPNDAVFFTIENSPVIHQADERDDPHSDIYYNAATIYPWAQDVYLMFTAQFRHFAPGRQPYIRPRTPGQWEDYGLLEVQLAVSRDGIQWQRPSREPYFPTGLADEWDRWYAVMCPGIAKRGNYLYHYYVSTGRTHDSVVLRSEYDGVQDLGGIGVVRQRFNGFVAACADETGGWLETPVLTFTGNRLRLNIDTGAMGTAFVELRDAHGNPIPGYTRDDCEEIGGNFIDQSVYWKANPDLSHLAGTPIKLHITLSRAKLYAFQFTSD